ncbi:MAG: zinc ribbon domain-containing protein [Acidobacteria bacterium]|nr:zinc ribbon domain-containing protein [Acidobacteriota bacterium]
MPLYEYECLKCGEHFDHIQKFSDPLLTVHEDCGGELRKLLSAPAIQFKGTGWYITDYARAGTADGDKRKSDDKAEAKSESKSEAKSDAKSDSKSESKSESKSDSKSDSKSESKSESKSSGDSGSSSKSSSGSKD